LNRHINFTSKKLVYGRMHELTQQIRICSLQVEHNNFEISFDQSYLVLNLLFHQTLPMKSFKNLTVFLLALGLWFAGANRALHSAEPLEVIFLGDRGHHQPQMRFKELAPVLQRRGIELIYTEDVSVLDLATLKKADALVLYANIDEIAPKHAEALLTYVNEGGGFVPLHCASFCFRNNAEVVKLMGAQFKRHGTGVFRTKIVKPEHELMQGFSGFESWDETYVHHLHHDANRTVLEVRVDNEGSEPWTWVSQHGKGRVFYTAWGHDSRTWTNPGFQNLVERGIRYVTGGVLDRPFDVPEMTQLPKDLKPFSYVDVGREIPNYVKSDKWGVQGEPMTKMQEPLDAQEAMKHVVTPKGFHIELFASEPDLQGKPICMAWDERGRLWVAETYDYPNELQPAGEGRDRIRICEDTNGDGKADKFTVFAEKLSIPTSIAFYKGGALVQNGTETIYLKDTNGDDVADERKTLITGWALGDTHGGVSNFQWGLDNWIWAMQGYNASTPEALGKKQQSFRMGFFRMRPDGSEVEFIRSTNNNTWGLGLSEEGLVFGSTANGNPSVFMPVPNRYYERVKSWTPSLTLSSIADSNRFLPIAEKIRQVDHHGGYTAGAGHALYTARQYPEQYWNRTAFVNGPTGHLVGTFVLQPNGSGFKSTNPFNLFASDDDWSAPIMSEVGPDGNVWIIDWYNFIVQHNPTPQGFKTGKGAAYETKLRDKKHGRIYRVVYDSAKPVTSPNLAKATPAQLVAALKHSVMLTRKHAQRLLVERDNADIAPQLIQLVQDNSVDSIGLNTSAIHALWTLHGLGQLDGKNPAATAAVVKALMHPSPGVRRNAVQVLPPSAESVAALLDAKLHFDPNPNVRLAALLALADLPPSNATGAAVAAALVDPINLGDKYIADAATSAAAHSAPSFLAAVAAGPAPTESVADVIKIVAGHYARNDSYADMGSILAALEKAPATAIDAVIEGLESNWNDDKKLQLNPAIEASLEKLLGLASPSSNSSIVKLANRWGSEKLIKYSKEIAAKLLETVQAEKTDDRQRTEAAKRAVEFQPESDAIVDSLLAAINPRLSPEASRGILAALRSSRAPGLGTKLIDRLPSLSPASKRDALAMMLARPALTTAYLSAVEAGKASLNDLALDQKQSLAAHPDKSVMERAKKMLASGGSLPSPDRQKVLEELAHTAHKKGDVAKGKEIYKQHCAKCHIHTGEGTAVGPDLTGMAVHPKEELLIHILDPSRSVENNFRAYTLLTADGVVLTGMLASESKTAVELFDTDGKKQAVLREDIEQLTASPKSIMPEGFEKSVNEQQLIDLLEFLTARGKYVPLDISKAATAATDRGMFFEREGSESMMFEDWAPKVFKGVPFNVVAPRDGNVLNAIQLHSPLGNMAAKTPQSVSLTCSGTVKALHMLGGVAGWGSPYGRPGDVSLIVRLHYADGQTEDHNLINGVHIADYIRRIDVPQSEFAFDLRGKQLRYLSITPRRQESITKIDLAKGKGDTSPIVMAITVESP
jgi:uncharacterized protein